MKMYLDDPTKGWDDWIKRDRSHTASVDGDWVPPWEFGESEGHPFRGNQWTGGTPGEQIAEALPHATISIDDLHPDVQKSVARSITAFASEFPGAARAVEEINTANLGVSTLGEFTAVGTGGVITLNDRFFGTDSKWRETERPDGKLNIGKDAYTYRGNDAARSTIDHELGHALFREARIQLEGSERQDFTRTLLGLSDKEHPYEPAPKPTAREIMSGTEPKASGPQGFIEPMPSTRSINNALKEISQYGAANYSTPDKYAGKSSRTYDLDEGFAEWFAARQQGDADGKSELLVPAWERVMEASR